MVVLELDDLPSEVLQRGVTDSIPYFYNRDVYFACPAATVNVVSFEEDIDIHRLKDGTEHESSVHLVKSETETETREHFTFYTADSRLNIDLYLCKSLCRDTPVNTCCLVKLSNQYNTVEKDLPDLFPIISFFLLQLVKNDRCSTTSLNVRHVMTVISWVFFLSPNIGEGSLSEYY